MSPNISNLKIQSILQSDQSMHIAPMQRRHVLKGMLGGITAVGLGGLGLSACGGSEPAITSVEFLGMAAP